MAGLLSVIAVGAGMLAGALTGEADAIPARAEWWWVAYALYLVAFLMVDERLPRPRGLSDDALLLVMVALGVIAFLLFPEQGWVAILLVVTATTVAFVWRFAAVLSVIAFQTLAVAVGTVMSAWPVSDVLPAVLAFGSFQGFAALVVRTARRETETRREMAVAHAELRAVSALLEVSSRDAERLRISRDLHDVVGHQLTALALELEVASHLASGEAFEHTDRARRIAKDLLGDIRRTVGRMRDCQQSIEPLLRSVAQDLPGLDVSLRIVEAGSVDYDQAHAVLRCVQESITNALRHAAAAHVDVVVRADATGISFRVSDDGQGTAEIVEGNGLTGMRERFEVLGGSLEFYSAAGSGFTTVGQLPARSLTGRSS